MNCVTREIREVQLHSLIGTYSDFLIDLTLQRFKVAPAPTGRWFANLQGGMSRAIVRLPPGTVNCDPSNLSWR